MKVFCKIRNFKFVSPIFSRLLLLCTGISIAPVYGVTIVYNMRIASPPTARQELYEKLGTHLPSILAMTYVHQSRKLKTGQDQLVDAGLVDYVYSWRNLYVRVDAAVGRVHEQSVPRSTTHTQMDDILVSTGYRHTATDRLNLAYSFLFSIPTHKDHGFEYFQFGTGHCSVGGQIDGIYSFGEQKTDALLLALRMLHFFKASARVPLPTTPICVGFDLGNVCDVFIAYQKRIKKHIFELGYNPSFAFSVSTNPELPERIPSFGIRNNGYAAYRYIFLTKKHPMGFSLGVSYGADAVPKNVGIKRVVSCWGAYGINF